MNFFDNIGNLNPPIQPQCNNQMIQNEINYKIYEIENKLKRLELRISQLENDKTNSNYNEIDNNSLYML